MREPRSITGSSPDTQAATFILRIEDTDLERSEARFEAADHRRPALAGHGLGRRSRRSSGLTDKGDRGPYRQSERLEHLRPIHRATARTKERLTAVSVRPRNLKPSAPRPQAEQRTHIYTGRCLASTSDAIKRNLASGMPFAVRLKIEDRPLRFNDIVRGPIEFAPETVNDPILVRSASAVSAGVPVYNYVVTVDDA